MFVLTLTIILAASIFVVAVVCRIAAYRHVSLGGSWNGEDEDNAHFLVQVAVVSMLTASIAYVLRDFLIALQNLAVCG